LCSSHPKEAVQSTEITESSQLALRRIPAVPLAQFHEFAKSEILPANRKSANTKVQFIVGAEEPGSMPESESSGIQSMYDLKDIWRIAIYLDENRLITNFQEVMLDEGDLEGYIVAGMIVERGLFERFTKKTKEMLVLGYPREEVDVYMKRARRAEERMIDWEGLRLQCRKLKVPNE